ncbi:MAG: DUF4363 family protein [Clostridia bacterium]|nr:DUF4363 family protein [Clostridia bacterium]MDD4386885.1 DUF4363 family protein [Clostridia bacterium]
MKNFIILTLAIIILIITSIWQIKYIEETSIFAISDVDYAMNLVQNDNFNGANTHIKELENTWKNMKKMWTIFINHNEIDDIEIALLNFKIYVELNNKDEALLYSEQLKHNLYHISEKQKVKIENVF